MSLTFKRVTLEKICIVSIGQKARPEPADDAFQVAVTDVEQKKRTSGHDDGSTNTHTQKKEQSEAFSSLVPLLQNEWQQKRKRKDQVSWVELAPLMTGFLNRHLDDPTSFTYHLLRIHLRSTG
jgi:hypothetical protein